MIEARALTKRYGNFAAIENISFKIQPGEVVGLLGPNGAGKTTTMRVLTGFMPPSSGSISIYGHDILKQWRKAKKVIGYLPEHPPLYPELTVDESLSFVAGLRNIPPARRRERIDWALEKTGTASIRKRLVGNISKGFKQRVGIAQAILHDPLFLVLDEPTIGLDPKQILEIRELIASLKGERAILLSSHILQEVGAVCDRVLIIHKGRLVADGKIADLTGGLQKKKFLVTVSGATEDIKARLEKLPGVQEVADYASNLEELFMQMTGES